jgi:hypothetical protein
MNGIKRCGISDINSTASLTHGRSELKTECAQHRFYNMVAEE